MSHMFDTVTVVGVGLLGGSLGLGLKKRGGAKTIRGYDEFRFRDARNLYVSAEYRWEVMPFVDFSLFFDAGKVFDDLDDFNFDKMHTGYGVGLRIHTPGGLAFRMDVAHSTEGFKLHISGGPTF